MPKLFKKKTSTKLNVFGDSLLSNTSTTFGKISIVARGDTANISIQDNDGNETKATLKVCSLSQLRATAFNETEDDSQIDTFYHDWKMRRNAKTIIKFADKVKQSILFTSTGNNVNDDFIKLCESACLTSLVVYFNEFDVNASLIKSTGKTTHEYKSHPIKNGMTDDHLKLLHEKFAQAKIFLQHGATVMDLTKLHADTLSKKLDFSPLLPTALKYISIEQALGFSLDSPPVPDSFKIHVKPQTNIPVGILEKGGFHFETHPNGMVITHIETKSTFAINVDFPRKFFKPSIDTKKKVSLLHDWYFLSSEEKDSKVKRLIYSPELNILQTEIVDSKFPKIELKSNRLKTLAVTPYYKELAFLKFLESQGATIEDLKSRYGMSVVELITMLNHHDTIRKLFSAGMTFQDIIDTDEKRFVYIVTHYDEVEQCALPFVDKPHTLFGLQSGQNFAVLPSAALTAWASVLTPPSPPTRSDWATAISAATLKH